MRAPVAAGTLRPWRRTLGTLPVLLRQQMSQRTCDTWLGFVPMMVPDTALG